jgi:hypothetical protein
MAYAGPLVNGSVDHDAPPSRAAAPRWLGVLVLLAVGLHALTKADDGKLAEMLWACHVATTLIGLGLLAGAPRVVAVGFLFHAAIGCPAYLLDLIVSRTTTPTSVLVHALPLAFGGLSVRRSGLPPRATLIAWGGYLALQPVSYVITDPTLNVNLAHAVWEPIAGLVPGIWTSRLINATMALTFLVTAAAIVRFWSRRRRADVGSSAARALPGRGGAAPVPAKGGMAR